MSAGDTSDAPASGQRAGDYNQALVRIIDAQIDTWTDHCESPVTIVRRKPKGRSRAQPALSTHAAAGTVALVAHGFELARLVRTLMPGGLTLATAPTVRAILEVTAVVHWLTTAPAAGDAWMDSIYRSRRLLQQDMTDSTLWGTHAASVPDADHAEAHTRDQLLERCKALPHDQHILYRALSERAHPTATVAALYIPDPSDGQVRLHPTPTAPTDSVEMTGRIARWLLWCHQAVDPYQGSPARKALQRFSTELNERDVPY